ncbi:MAG: hypothetical protein V4564_16540 [Pseudomonadota bacterium]
MIIHRCRDAGIAVTRRHWAEQWQFFPQLRDMLRENAFLAVLRESAGKAAGILMAPHGNFTGVPAGISGNGGGGDHDLLNSEVCAMAGPRVQPTRRRNLRP